MNYHFSSRVPKSDVDPVGNILKIAGKPGIISFAGGLPAPELFPVDQITQATDQVLKEKGKDALQYGSSQGIQELRDVIVDRVKIEGINTDADHVMVATGSQQTLDLTGKIFLDRGDTVIVEKPTYLCAVDVFKSYGAHFVGVDMDEDGMKMDMLEKALIENPSTKLIYTIPNFQNPTGRTMTLSRREKLVELAEKYDVMVLEDNPYGAVRFAGKNLPSIKSLDKSGHVIYMGTFSKILAPGMRLGWIVTDTKLLNKYTMMKQSADLHTDNLSQYIVAKYFEMFNIDEHIQSICHLYQKREQLMMSAIHKYFPSNVKCSQPEGGMFIWVEVPGIEDTQALFDDCIKNNVAFVPGEPFYGDEGTPGTFRLNYSNMHEDQIEEGIKRLGAAIQESLTKSLV
ncbi:MAG: PLP-dependent aminotransferase family protein [Lentilactobacillus diolivorans]|uniref:GntR family transcriptional regulator n=2 Tax=Lentilactobacillus diolivorans TaxID=179838 RepID=A0A0R1SGK8_9LACO|nr:PLP-dependent aminotransferase family protein [Lentilactobacillus diolivorans]KRL65554.1 GntR family transcriptional regulator [Lentilactobacillus diolivorans DSM 14421]GEP25285.1 aminotransferase [Lentilactobacillus diolivorans]